ncbi:hypothetical protein [Blastococcus sp. Marseille-P5729]|uniref:hypothetical protein n=1 Tax=Blastococcus sp. Marseille-P5729 TaxID=2086582 RepID=UPI000D10D676|nr:hypothetical protein [Blastococcus sp. Marseille-P5729]
MPSRLLRAARLIVPLLALTLLGLVACASDSGGADPGSDERSPFLLRIQSDASTDKWKIPAIKGRGQSVTDGSGGDLAITVVDVGDGTADIRVDPPVTPADDPGSEPRTDFTVANGDPAKFVSETGTTWTVSYEEISVE